MKKESAGKPELEYRYYEMIPGGPALFLNKEGIYKEDADVPHFHNVMEIGYCYQGKGCMLLRDERVPFEEGTFTLISGKFPHMTISEGDVFGGWKYLFVDAEGLLREFYGKESVTARRLLSGISDRTWMFSGSEEKDNGDLILQMFKVMEEQRTLYKEEFKGLMTALLIRMAARSGGEEAPAEEASYPSRNSMIISRAVDYISKVPERPVKIEELAKMCHISETHFRRVFGECMQMTPVEYINRVRVRRACDALERTNFSIGDIAAAAGFGTVSTFNRNFRQIMGISPHEWRKRTRRQTSESTGNCL
mgnify:FL=1